MGDKPYRVQLRRTKGWRMPENTVSVARPGKWGNPFRVGQTYLEEEGRIEVPNAAVAVALYRDWMDSKLDGGPQLHRVLMRSLLRKLRGKNLACFCPLDAPCHADVLLELANKEPHPMTNLIDKLERAEGPDRSCRKCVYSKGHGCNRDKRDGFTFSQAYETRYTDSDFCGPTRRYFKPLRARSQGGE